MDRAPEIGTSGILPRAEFPRLLEALRAEGYSVVGPTVRDGAIVLGEIRTDADLPIGWTDRPDAGTYRMERRSDEALFGYGVGPHCWKKYLFPARDHLWTARGGDGGLTIDPVEPADPPRAFLGMRACEIAALGITDRVFTGGPATDRSYAHRRGRILRIGVQCGTAGATCFCASMGTGPGIAAGADLVLTELIDSSRHRFLLTVGTEEGARVATRLPLLPAPAEAIVAADAIVARTARSQGRRMDPGGLESLLAERLEHPRWVDVARRCLSCANCTMVCPTCFCHTTEEVPNVEGTESEHWRRWDSCFQLAHSQLHTTSVRASPRSRYRQWLTHKLGTWSAQFGTSGCVGCGRCIVWCPVGIDLTEEVAALRVAPVAPSGGAAR